MRSVTILGLRLKWTDLLRPSDRTLSNSKKAGRMTKKPYIRNCDGDCSPGGARSASSQQHEG